jgi:solute carrier family 25 protein 39/40
LLRFLLDDLLYNKEMQSTFQVLKEIYGEEGWKGLTRGIIPRVAKVAPACAIMISSYEIGKLYFNNTARK